MVGVAALLLEGFTDLLLLAGCLMFMVFVLPDRGRRLAAIGVIGLAVGYGVASLRLDTASERSLPDGVPTFIGTVTSDPRLAARGKTAILEWKLPDGERFEALIFYAGIEPPGRGDVIEVSGAWSDGGSPLFFADRITLVQRAGRLERLRRSFRETARDRVLERVPGSNGSLALGLVIGDDSGLTESERDNLRFSGLSHITAVSGSNVALVIGAVAFLLRALNRTNWFWLALQLAAVSFYVWIVGLDPPIVRAAIMGSLALLALQIGRPAHLYTLLALAGAAMCLLDPQALTSLGFQLSFLSMVGLALAGDIIARFQGNRRTVVAALLSPTGAALLTAPLLAARFGTFSPGTIPANIAVAPLIGPATLLGGLVALIPADFVSGKFAGLVLWLGTGFILDVSNVVGGAPWSTVNFAPLSSSQTVGLYLALALAAAPLVPEARLTGYRIGRWAESDPARATATALSSAALLVILALLLD
jgi:ComEC/Rec2-related protein